MKKNFGELLSYIARALKDSANIEIDNELLKDRTRAAMLEIASKGRFKQVEVSIPAATLVAGTAEYAPEDLGINDFIRPVDSGVLWNGEELPEMSNRDMVANGYRGSVAATGSPEVHSWQSGKLRLAPIPDAACVAGTGVLTLIYTASPIAMDANTDPTDPAFREHWEELLMWGVLYRKLQGMKAEDQAKLPISWQRVEAEWKGGLELVYKEVWDQPTAEKKLIDRGGETDVNDFDTNFYGG